MNSTPTKSYLPSNRLDSEFIKLRTFIKRLFTVVFCLEFLSASAHLNDYLCNYFSVVKRWRETVLCCLSLPVGNAKGSGRFDLNKEI